MIYNQKKKGKPRGTCAGFGWAQLLGQITGKYITHEDVWDFYEKYDIDRVDGLTVPELYSFCLEDPLGGIKPRSIQNAKQVYRAVWGKRWAKFYMKRSAKLSNSGLLIGLRIIDGLPTKDGEVVIQKGLATDFHIVFAKYKKTNRGDALEIYNSHGTKWGKNGVAMLYLDEGGWDMIQDVFKIELDLKHS